MHDDYAPPRRMQPGTKFMFAFLAISLFLSALGGVVFLASPGHRLSPSVEASATVRVQPGVPLPQENRPHGDPWPECAAVRKWLQIHANDPSSVEVVEWIKRYHHDAPETKGSVKPWQIWLPTDPPDVFSIEARIRTRNNFGALENVVMSFRARKSECLQGVVLRH